jgi:hypothetical protein
MNGSTGCHLVELLASGEERRIFSDVSGDSSMHDPEEGEWERMTFVDSLILGA